MTVCPCRSVTFLPTATDFLTLSCSCAWWHTGDHQCYHRDRLYCWPRLPRR